MEKNDNNELQVRDYCSSKFQNQFGGCLFFIKI